MGTVLGDGAEHGGTLHLLEADRARQSLRHLRIDHLGAVVSDRAVAGSAYAASIVTCGASLLAVATSDTVQPIRWHVIAIDPATSAVQARVAVPMVPDPAMMPTIACAGPGDSGWAIWLEGADRSMLRAARLDVAQARFDVPVDTALGERSTDLTVARDGASLIVARTYGWQDGLELIRLDAGRATRRTRRPTPGGGHTYGQRVARSRRGLWMLATESSGRVTRVVLEPLAADLTPAAPAVVLATEPRGHRSVGANGLWPAPDGHLAVAWQTEEIGPDMVVVERRPSGPDRYEPAYHWQQYLALFDPVTGRTGTPTATHSHYLGRAVWLRGSLVLVDFVSRTPATRVYVPVSLPRAP
jgi:hypothetical protein